MIRIYSQANFEASLIPSKTKPTNIPSTNYEEEEGPYLPPEFLKESDQDKELYTLVAKCETDSNPFFFNVDAAMKYIVINSPYAYQKEILAYGDVMASKVAYKKNVDSKSPVPELLRLLK